MKVYIVFREYYGCQDNSCGDVLLGVYSSMDAAISARTKLVNDDIVENQILDIEVRQSLDDYDNPVLTLRDSQGDFEEFTYTIEEWDVQ